MSFTGELIQYLHHIFWDCRESLIKTRRCKLCVQKAPPPSSFFWIIEVEEETIEVFEYFLLMVEHASERRELHNETLPHKDPSEISDSLPNKTVNVIKLCETLGRNFVF